MTARRALATKQMAVNEMRLVLEAAEAEAAAEAAAVQRLEAELDDRHRSEALRAATACAEALSTCLANEEQARRVRNTRRKRHSRLRLESVAPALRSLE